MSDRILAAVVDELRARIDLEDVRVESLTVGDAAVLVELEGVTASDDPMGRTAGLAHRPEGGASALPEDVDALVGAAVSPSTGSRGADDRLLVAAGLAAINALSAPFVDWRLGDPMALLAADVDAIATVGLFGPAFRKFSDVEVRVIERRPDREPPGSVPDGVRVSVHDPADAEAAIEGAEIVFVTGSAFVYGGVDRYLDLAAPSRTVVLVGASASFLPEPAFAAGVDVLAGAFVADPTSVREAVRAGACGTDLHDAGLRKGYVATERSAGLDLSLPAPELDSPTPTHDTK